MSPWTYEHTERGKNTAGKSLYKQNTDKTGQSYKLPESCHYSFSMYTINCMTERVQNISHKSCCFNLIAIEILLMFITCSANRYSAFRNPSSQNVYVFMQSIYKPIFLSAIRTQEGKHRLWSDDSFTAPRLFAQDTFKSKKIRYPLLTSSYSC